MTKEEYSAQSSVSESEEVKEQIEELSEDMELISPGSMLQEAREKLALSQEDIANKLNFRASLVANMELDIFDAAIPATFNRGYLVSYAKLVSVDVEDILASYDVLGAANIQRSEMQSFSKQTVKEAEHSRVMWLSYLILIVLVGLTALWWQQDNKQSATVVIDTSVSKGAQTEKANQVKQSRTDIQTGNQTVNPVDNTEIEPQPLDSDATAEQNGQSSNIIESEESIKVLAVPALERETQAGQATFQSLNTEQNQTQSPLISKAVFTFSGDCWVNIYDATGERIAWGIKKSGYVMHIEGASPLRITLGKPELASIVFNEEAVDMSTFEHGNIAKFTLPLTPN